MLDGSAYIFRPGCAVSWQCALPAGGSGAARAGRPGTRKIPYKRVTLRYWKVSNRIQMKRNEELRIYRLICSVGDFRQALSAADFLLEHDNDETYGTAELRRFKCYETALIAAYARPFSESKNGVPKLSIKMCDVLLDEEESELHSLLLRLRNKVFAHSDFEMMRFRSNVLDLSSIVGTEHKSVFFQFDEHPLLEELEPYSVTELIRKLLHGLYEKLHSIAQEDIQRVLLSRNEDARPFKE